jgi:hypothetical protein
LCETRLTAAPSPSTTLVRSAALRASEARRADSGHSLRNRSNVRLAESRAHVIVALIHYDESEFLHEIA